MIFGNKELFAIEAHLTQGNDAVFMQFCYWLRNNRVGELDQYVLIYPAIDNFNQILRYRGERGIILSNNDINRVIKLLLDEYNDSNFININYNKGENLDGYNTFLIETESYDWLVCKDTVANKVYDVKIPKKQFYNQVNKLLVWIRESTVLVLKASHTDALRARRGG